jgi:hypothetical protein
MRASRREHVEAVLKRVNIVRAVDGPGSMEVKAWGEGESGEGNVEQHGSELESNVQTGVGNPVLEEGMDGMAEDDIADHNVWV